MESPTLSHRIIQILVKSRSQQNYGDALVAKELIVRVVESHRKVSEATVGFKDQARNLKYVLADAKTRDIMDSELFEQIWTVFGRFSASINVLGEKNLQLSNVLMDQWRNLMNLAEHNPLLKMEKNLILRYGLDTINQVTEFSVTVVDITVAVAKISDQIRVNPGLYSSETWRKKDFGESFYQTVSAMTANINTRLKLAETELAAVEALF